MCMASDYFIAWADVLSHQASQQSVRAGRNSDGVRTPAVLRDRLFTLFHLRPQDELLRLHHFCNRRLHLGLDRCVLRLKIEQRNMHTWLPLSAALLSVRHKATVFHAIAERLKGN